MDGIFLRVDYFETEEHTTTHFTDDLDAHSLEQIEGYATKGWLEETSRQPLVQEYGSGFKVSRFCVPRKSRQNEEAV